MPRLNRIAPCLWFDNEAEEAAEFYTAIFPNSQIRSITRYGEAGREFHGKAPGSVMTVAFELDGQSFTALNGGPIYHFTEAISFQVNCDTQAEIDHYWDTLTAGGDPPAQQCGWLKDRFGVSWQIVPSILPELLGGTNPATAERVMQAVLRMKKIDIQALQQAHQL